MNKEIDLSKVPRLERMQWLVPALERFFCIPQINHILRDLPDDGDKVAKVAQTLDYLDIRVKYNLSQRIANLANRPLIVVSNHPFGGIDGLIIAKILLEQGHDVKIFTNFLLDYLKPLTSLFISVNPFNKNGDSTTISGIKEARNWLANNGTLIIFPSGTVSHWHWRQWRVCDPAWQNSAVRLAKQYQANILPLFVHGRNHKSFYLAGALSAKLRTILLPRQLFNQPEREVCVTSYPLISPEDLSQCGNYAQQTQFLRQLIYQSQQGSFADIPN